MKYEIHVNQKAIIDNQLNIDLVEGAIMDFCRYFSGSSACRFIIENGKRYHWFAHKNICDQLPILGLKPDSAYRRMKSLCEKLFLEAHPENKRMNASWYAFGELSDLLFGTIGNKSEPSEKYPKASKTIGKISEGTDENPMPIGSKSEGPSDENPIYKEIIDKEIIYKEVVEATADALPSVPEEKNTFPSRVGKVETPLEAEKKETSTPDSARPPSPKKQPMEKPTLKEVETHFEICASPNWLALKFFNYYESNGWMVGKQPMRKWQAAANNWIADERKNPTRHATNTNPLNQRQRSGQSIDNQQFGAAIDQLINAQYGHSNSGATADGSYAVVVDDPAGNLF